MKRKRAFGHAGQDANWKTDRLLDLVIKHYGGKRYVRIYVPGPLGTRKNEGVILLRLSDHSPNIDNIETSVPRPDYVISVVIADFDKTAHKMPITVPKNILQLWFTSENDLIGILEVISSTVATITGKIQSVKSKLADANKTQTPMAHSSPAVKSNNGQAGGYLVGRAHSEGGIKAVNMTTGQPIELQRDEVIINDRSVKDRTLHDFNGEKMTNLQILNQINKSGGGVELMEDGGKVRPGATCGCTGKFHQLNGEQVTDYEIAKKMADGGSMCGCDHSAKKNGRFPSHLLPVHYATMDFSETPKYKGGGYIKEDGNEYKGDFTHFKGLKFKYENPFQINKAIEELLDSRDDDEFSADEKQFMRYYSGYGGLEKFGAEGVGLLYEYFTPALIAQKMWGLAYKWGYNGGSMLEPSCGVGEFFNYAPEAAEKHGLEINKYSHRICEVLHPDANVQNKYFEQFFIGANRDSVRKNIKNLKTYDLIIGNPPYGKFEGKFAGMGEKAFTHANNYIDYFIFRSLDILKKDGLLIFIIGAEVAAGGIPFLQQKMNSVKKEISEKSILLDAYRLPNGVFERTDVLTDIIVLQKI